MCLYLICIKISSSTFIYTGYEYMPIVVVVVVSPWNPNSVIFVFKNKVLRGPASSHHVWRWMEFYPVAWALSPSVLSLRPFCSHVLGPKKPGTSGKLYRALWRTCGMFRASRWCFTSGRGLQKWKGCIEAWFWEALGFYDEENHLLETWWFLLDPWVSVYLPTFTVNNQQKM